MLIFWVAAPTAFCIVRNLIDGRNWLRTLKDITGYTAVFEPYESHPEAPFKVMTLISENIGMLGMSILLIRMTGANITWV